MKLEEKYTKEALEHGVKTYDFFYDLIFGGYIVPEKILLDKRRAIKLQDAADLLEDWVSELTKDEILEEL